MVFPTDSTLAVSTEASSSKRRAWLTWSLAPQSTVWVLSERFAATKWFTSSSSDIGRHDIVVLLELLASEGVDSSGEAMVIEIADSARQAHRQKVTT